MILRWLKQWNDWSGDREMDLAIRAKLRSDGYAVGRSKVVNFRLVAIERPGWVSIYEFNVEVVDSEGCSTQLYGVARDDARRTTTVKLYQRIGPRREQRDCWSEGMILAPHARR